MQYTVPVRLQQRTELDMILERIMDGEEDADITRKEELIQIQTTKESVRKVSCDGLERIKRSSAPSFIDGLENIFFGSYTGSKTAYKSTTEYKYTHISCCLRLSCYQHCHLYSR